MAGPQIRDLGIRPKLLNFSKLCVELQDLKNKKTFCRGTIHKMRVPGGNLTPFTRKRRLGSSCKHLTTQDPNNLNCPFTQTWRGMLGMCELHLRRSSVLPAPFTITTFHLLQLGSSLCILINNYLQ